MIARSYWHTFGLPVAVTRFANLYGGGDLNLSRLVPECAIAAIEGRRPVIRSDGNPQRDFLYVEDAVQAYLAIWSLLQRRGAAGEAFNAGGDRPRSVREVVELVCRAAGTGVEPDVRGERDPDRRDRASMGGLDEAACCLGLGTASVAGGRNRPNRPVVPRVPRPAGARTPARGYSKVVKSARSWR